jgi:hypothetical protein
MTDLSKLLKLEKRFKRGKKVISLLCVICYGYILYLDLGFQCTCMNICSVYCKDLNVPV